jgi:mRNA interferase MazF
MRRPSVTCEPFDVVVVPFPFTDRVASKRRPAVVLSRPATIAPDQVILAMITSSTFESWASDVEIGAREAAGLTVPCRVLMKVFTLAEEQILRRLGRLSSRDADAVAASLRQVFALA